MTPQFFPTGIPIQKRLFDLIIILIGSVLFIPLLLIIAIFVRIFHGTPVIFTQVRPGYQTKPFTMYKFRSMNNKHGHDGKLLPDKERITPFGKFLRSTSLDELPELYNVLRGEMSLVGPRPLLMKYIGLYSPEQNRRHDVLPGITGWAQINGRNNVSWEIKFELDVWYVDHHSIWLDIKIIATTLFKVFARKDITQSGNVTTTEFKGTPEE